MKTILRVVFLCVATTFALMLGAPSAFAHMGAERFKQEKRVSVPPKGARGQIEVRSLSGGSEVRLLRADGTDYVGAFEIRNTGLGPLLINRVFVIDAEDDPRSPPGLVAQPEGGLRAAIGPGQARKYLVTWHAADALASELYAHLVIDSDAAQPDATVVDPPKIIGVVAQRRLGVERHSLSLLIAIPFLLALLAFASRFVRAIAGRTLRIAARALMLLEAGVALFAFVSFDRGLAKRDGNDGLQLIERAILDRDKGLEFFLGVDGVSLALVLTVSVVAVAAAFATEGDKPRSLGGAALLVASAMAALVAQTTFLFLIGWALMVIGAVVLTLDSSRKASVKIAVVGALSTFALGASAIWMSSRATSYLVDATEPANVYAFPDLARAHFTSDLTPLLGLPGYRAAWLLSFLGAAAFLPLLPLHGWLRDLGRKTATGDRLAPAQAALLVGLLPAVSGYAVLRLAVLVQPDGAHWGGESLPTIGVAMIFFGGASALAERSLTSLSSPLLVARAGLLLLLAFSLTPIGIESAVGLVFVQPIASALFALSAGTIATRIGDDTLNKLSGIGRSAPILSAGVILGALALSSPVLPGLAGPLTGLVGSLGRNPALTCAAAFGVVLSALAVARGARSVFGSQPVAWRASKYLEPFGGTVPDLRRSELSWAAPLFVLMVLLAFAPRLFLGPADPVMHDFTPRLDADGPTRVALQLSAPASSPARNLLNVPT